METNTEEIIAGAITSEKYLHLFLRSREAMEVSPGTLQFYRSKLGRFLSELDPDTAQRQDIEAYLLSSRILVIGMLISGRPELSTTGVKKPSDSPAL